MPVLINMLPATVLASCSHNIGYPRRGASLHGKPGVMRQALPASATAAEPRNTAELRYSPDTQSAPPGLPRPLQPPVAPKPAEVATVAKPGVTASLLLEKEEELRVMLEPAPGVLAPKASAVAALRKEIASLRERLRQEILAAAPGTKLDLPGAPTSRTAVSDRGSEYVPMRSILNDLDGPTTSHTSGSNGSVVSGHGHGVSQGAAGRVRNALRLVETRLASGDASSVESVLATEPNYAVESDTTVGGFSSLAQPAGKVDAQGQGQVWRRVAEPAVVPSSPEQLALEVLQIENARLRARVEELLSREAQLRALAQRFILAADQADAEEPKAPEMQ